jgi:hypothetical protein
MNEGRCEVIDTSTARKWGYLLRSKVTRPTAEEERIAEEDVTCKQRSQVLSTLLHVETSLQKSCIADHGKQFAEILKYKNSVDRRSRQVLS